MLGHARTTSNLSSVGRSSSIDGLAGSGSSCCMLAMGSDSYGARRTIVDRSQPLVRRVDYLDSVENIDQGGMLGMMNVLGGAWRMSYLWDSRLLI